MLNKTITIDSVEIKQAKTGNWKYIIKDKEGDKYYFYKDTKNGESEAFVSFNSLSPKNGDNLTIGYNEEDKTFVNDKGQTINYKDRFIATILRVSNPAPLTETHDTAASVASSRDFDKEAVGKCQSLFLQAFIQSGHSFSEAKLQSGQARRLAEIVVFGHTITPEEPPQDIDVEDIPL